MKITDNQKGIIVIIIILFCVFLYNQIYSIKKNSLEEWKHKEIIGVVVKKYTVNKPNVWYLTIENNNKIIFNDCDFCICYFGDLSKRINIGDSLVKKKNSFYFKVVENINGTYEIYEDFNDDYAKEYKKSHWINPKGWNGKIE